MTECAICSDEVTKETGQVVLSCGHTFHMKCVVQWYQKPDGSGTCPCCRAPPSEHERLVSVSVSDEESSVYDSDDDEDNRSVTDQTDLMVAARDGMVEALTLLLTSVDIDIDAKDSDGDTALVYATISDSSNGPECMRLLLDAGADVNVCGYKGYTPIMHAIRYGKTTEMHLLLGKGASTTTIAENGMCPLQLAASEGDPDILRALMALDRTVDRYEYALHSAVVAGSAECVTILLEVGVNANCKIGDITPLMIAVGSSTNSDIVDNLLHHGANPNETDKEGWNSFLWFANNPEKDPMVMASLLDYGTKWARQPNGRWHRVMETWGYEDGPSMPFYLAEHLTSSATKLQALWRGFRVRKQKTL